MKNNISEHSDTKAIPLAIQYTVLLHEFELDHTNCPNKATPTPTPTRTPKTKRAKLAVAASYSGKKNYFSYVPTFFLMRSNISVITQNHVDFNLRIALHWLHARPPQPLPAFLHCNCF